MPMLQVTLLHLEVEEGFRETYSSAMFGGYFPTTYLSTYYLFWLWEMGIYL